MAGGGLVVVLVAPAAAVSSPNDPQFGKQWGLSKIGAPQAWGTGTGGGAIVAIIDTGVDLNHEDLRDKLVPGWDFVGNDSVPQDETKPQNLTNTDCPGNPGHGTHVAGIVAAATNNGKGVAGTAPGARILPIRVLDSCGSGTSGAVSAGIDYAIQRKATVINLSLGEDVVVHNISTTSLDNAINKAWNAGIVVAVAAGNNVLFPSGYSGVNGIAVAATDRNDGKPDFSSGSGDAKWGMAAPGGGSETDPVSDDIFSTLPGGYGYLRGTSMAAPFVAGAAAILRSLGLSPQATVDKLLSTAVDVGIPGNDPIFGSGRLNLAKAVQGLTPASSPSAPAPSSSSGSHTGSGSPGSTVSPGAAGGSGGSGSTGSGGVVSGGGTAGGGGEAKAGGGSGAGEQAAPGGDGGGAKDNPKGADVPGKALFLAVGIAFLIGLGVWMVKTSSVSGGP
jgi:thermitase